jgi:hypothetical protein
MIQREDYFKHRDVEYAADFTSSVSTNADLTIALANQLLYHFGEDRKVNSGWRPPAVNAGTPGAAPFSRHMTGEAIDLWDPEGDLDEWCLANLNILTTLGLWMEHPASTKGWCHVQTVPPKSRNRVFYP